MKELIEKYIITAKPALSAKEITENYSTIPIMKNGEKIGFFSLQFYQFDIGKLAIIEGMYLDPEHTGKGLRFYLPQLFMQLKDIGIEWVQGNVTPTIAKFIKRKYKIEPESIRFFEPIEKLTGNYSK